METFIDEGKINDLLRKEKNLNWDDFNKLMVKSVQGKTFTLEETAQLIKFSKISKYQQMIFDHARYLKKNVYGDRIVLFAPLYIGNKCINNCQYCGFKIDNNKMRRKTLSERDIDGQITSLLQEGHRRIIAVFGEHPNYSPAFIAKTIKDIYKQESNGSKITRININAAPVDLEGFKLIKEAGIGTYQIFQETYHKSSYHHYHPQTTPKGDYENRLYSLDRAFEAGIDDVGIGVLLGLYHWEYELLGIMSHVHHFEEKFNVGPHTISFPRLKKAQGISHEDKYMVSDRDFKKIVAILRIAVPYTGLILTARENENIRNELIDLGITQIDGGSRIELNGYSGSKNSNTEQFTLEDQRSLEEVIGALVDHKHIPSFCTGCYRKGRTGEHFMEYAIPGFIQNYCTPNALFSFMEYLTYYASDSLREKGECLIREKVNQIVNVERKNSISHVLDKISLGEIRDHFY